MALVDTEKATRDFGELLDNGFYNLDDWSKNSAEDYTKEKAKRDLDAVKSFVQSDAFSVVNGLR